MAKRSQISSLTVHERITLLEEKLKAIMQLTGLVPENWVSPHRAESLISLSRHQIKQIVDKAEIARATEKQCSLSLGTHYRFVPPNGNIQINWERWQEVLAMPPEQREGLD